MKDFDNWLEVTKGLYRYVIAAGACYEIHILCHCKDTDILTAKASLYIVGEWHNKINGDYFERECLIDSHPVFECIEAAIKDDEENNNY